MKIAVPGTTSAAVPLMITNLTSGSSIRVHDDTDSDPSVFAVTSAGDVAVGRTTASAKLHVEGELVVGNSGLACSGATEGALRYNAASICMELCDSLAWSCIATVVCDTVPDAMSFTALTGLGKSTLYTSSIVSINGTDSGCGTPVSISGDGSPEYRICSNSSCTAVVQDWTSSSLAFDLSTNYIQLRATTASTGNTLHTATLTAGGVTGDWDITTVADGPCGAVDATDIGTTCSDGSVYAGISPDGNADMYVARCDIGMTWDGSACTGTGSLLAWNDNTANYLYIGVSSSIPGAYHTEVLVASDSNSVTAGTQPHNAAAACDSLNVHGQTDWYLPASAELAVIYENLMDGTPNDNSPDPVITGFSTGTYWSSSEQDNDEGYFKTFSNASASGTPKTSDFRVRCARKE